VATSVKWQRVNAALEGAKTPRPPFGLWQHFPNVDLDALELATESVAYFRRYDMDYAKVQFRSSYGIEDWGVALDGYDEKIGFRITTKHVIGEPADWYRLLRLPPDRGALGEQLQVLSLVRDALGGEAPVIATVFAPSMIAKFLAGDTRFVQHLREAPDAVRAGLETVSATVADFGEACLRSGADGIFYAINAATREILQDDAEYELLAAFDRAVAERLHASSKFTLVHLHGDDVFFDRFTDFPGHALNWNDRAGKPALVEARARTRLALAGGIDQEHTLLDGGADRIAREIAEAIAQLEGRGLLLAPGCCIPVATPHANLLAVRHALEEL
jgi:uroporphyrinogen decarboxylase